LIDGEKMSSLPTGIPGLDELLGGGFPENRVILVIGGPGAGKTIFASQFLYKGIVNYDENGIFISLDETKGHLFSEMNKFSWDFKKAEEEGKFAFIDATLMSRRTPLMEKMYNGTDNLKRKQLPIDKLIEQLEDKIHEIGAKRVVLDTLATLFLRFPDKIERRIAIVDLIEALSEMNITTIITTELESTALERKLTLEEYMVHGVILMEKLFSEGSTVRALQIDKMRTAKINENKVPYTIDKDGIEIYPDVKLFK
jgi:KaiC/GvpD/RAD55 family RecA-like ATPase